VKELGSGTYEVIAGWNDKEGCVFWEQSKAFVLTVSVHNEGGHYSSFIQLPINYGTSWY